jgi:hypothetical protein
MSYLTFDQYIIEEMKEYDIKNKDVEYDDYSIVVDIDYTTQE